MLQVMISAACAASMAYFFCSHHGALVLSPVRALTISSSSSGVSTMSTSMGCPRSLCMSCMCCKMLSLMCNKVCGTEYLAGLGRWLEPLWCWLQRSTLNFRLLETFYGAKICLAWFAVFAAFWACACHPWNGLAPAPPFWPKKSPKLKSKSPVLPLLCPDLSPAGSLLSQSKWRPAPGACHMIAASVLLNGRLAFGGIDAPSHHQSLVFPIPSHVHLDSLPRYVHIRNTWPNVFHVHCKRHQHNQFLDIPRPQIWHPWSNALVAVSLSKSGETPQT